MRTQLISMLVISLVAAAATAAVPSSALSQTSADFCSEVQRSLTGTTQAITTRWHKDYESFVKSKPQIRPLEAQQYVQYEAAAATQPMRISCKTKTADHINAVYGSGSALQGAPGSDVSCRDINRNIIGAVWSAMPAAERGAAAFAPSRIMLDADDIGFMGSKFVAPYEFAYLGADGLPHLLSKALRVDWENWVWKLAPERVRGTHYCHLIAPEFARRLMRGQVQLKPNTGD